MASRTACRGTGRRVEVAEQREEFLLDGDRSGRSPDDAYGRGEELGDLLPELALRALAVSSENNAVSAAQAKDEGHALSLGARAAG